jgi:hypothetical protein
LAEGATPRHLRGGQGTASLFSAAVNGIEAFPVEAEVNCGWGDTIIVIVSLTDGAANPACFVRGGELWW